MTLQEIRTFYNYFTTTADEVGMVLYILMEQNGERFIRQADLDDISRQELTDIYLDSVARVILDDDLQYMPISESDARKDIWYRYDLAQVPARLQTLSEILQQGQHPIFNFGEFPFDTIKGFIITIGNEEHKIALYKNHSHLNLVRAARVLNFKYSNQRFERVREDVIKLSSQIDFFQMENSLFILNIKALETGFHFETIIRNQAAANIAIIEALNLLEDTGPLVEMIEDLRHAKKMMRVKPDSPVMHVPVANIIAFVKSHPPIMRKFKVTENGDRLRLHTKVSQGLFLKLLNDDLLTSQLTNQYYDSLAKDNMVIDEEEAGE